MQSVSAFIGNSINYLSTIGFSDIIDILIVAVIIYKVIDLIRKTSSYNVAKGLFVILIALGLSGVFNLTMINYLLKK